MNFQKFKQAIAKQWSIMQQGELYVTNQDKDAMYAAYLAAYPEGTNPIFRERTEHDCTCCRQFIKNVGNVVAIIEYKIVTIWDFDPKGVDEGYVAVAKAMAELVRKGTIIEPFLHFEGHAGTDHSFESLVDGGQKQWDHFFVNIDQKFVKQNADIPTALGKAREAHQLLKDSLTKIKVDAIDIILELTATSTGIYRGEEHRPTVEAFSKVKAEFDKITDKNQKTLFLWNQSRLLPPNVSYIKNSVIGTLLLDLSTGTDLDTAVRSFEQKVAPTNYRRTSAVVTPKMVALAKEKVEELGLTSALQRRHATLADISINDILYGDHTAKAVILGTDPFAGLSNSNDAKNLNKVDEMTMDEFLKNVLPTATSLEILLENRLERNFVSVVAPMDYSSKPLFKWANQMSWSYAGEVADSIKERVKEAGGRTEGDLCCRLAWEYTDDLDFHMFEPNGGHIYFGNKRSMSHNGGMLDVDANGGSGMMAHPVENIVYENSRRMADGNYKLMVNNYARRSTGTKGFTVEIEFSGQTLQIVYDKVVREDDKMLVAEFSVKNGVIELVSSLPSTQVSRKIAALDTQKYHKVSLLMNSPNFWYGQRVGNQHYFFIVQDMKMDKPVRGFYNEFLKHELTPHRKVFELLGSKLLVPESVDQLTGIGLTSSEENHVYLRVSGAFTRTIKVTV